MEIIEQGLSRASRRPPGGRRPTAIVVVLALAVVLAAACDPGSAGRSGASGGAAASSGGTSADRPSPSTPSPPGSATPGASADAGATSDAGQAAGPVPGPSGASVPPASTRDPARFGFAAKGLRGEVMAFVTTSQVDDALRDLDFAATSTIVFFSLEAARNGAIRHDGRWTIWNNAPVDRLIARAHETGTRVVVSLARFAWSAAQTKISVELLASPAARARLAAEVADEVVRRGVDGVNVDFEPIPRGQKGNFTDLVRRIRHELDLRGPGYQLTFAVTGHFESYDVGAALRPGAADAVYLMGYHYAGTFSTIAHGTAPLDGSRYSVNDAIRGLLKVAAPEQLIVGVPYYGHLWPTASGALNARTTGDGYDVRYADARDIARARGSTYDPIEEVRRVAWRVRSCATCALRWFQLYFDDARSLGAKWAAFRSRGLLGTGIWTSAFEGPSGDLDAALRKVWLVGG